MKFYKCADITTRNTISVIEGWNDKHDPDEAYSNDDFMDQMDYKLLTVQNKDYFLIYKSKARYSMHYFSKKFFVSIFY